MNLSSQSELQFSHLNVNMWITWVRDEIRKSLYGTLAFFTEKLPENIYKNGDLKSIVNPVLSIWWDVIGFSEVYGKQNLDILIELLEARWYDVYFVDAFEMWSQNIPWEHLYNVVWVKNDVSSSSRGIKIHTQVHNQRKKEWMLISLKNMLSSKNSTEIGGKIETSKILYKRLVTGILDWAITSFELSPDFVFTHLHVHADNKNLEKYFLPHLDWETAHMIFWDFNIWDLDSFILKPPFSWIWYKTFLAQEEKTYSYAKWFSSLPLHTKPDNVVWNPKIKNIKTTSLPSLSDHNLLLSRIKVD